MKEKLWIYPGSFDPITYGHIDIIERASRLCDTLVIGVVDGNAEKKSTLFSLDERVNMVETAVSHLDNVEVESFSSLQVEFFAKKHASAAVRGLRSSLDYETEFVKDGTQHMLDPEFETVLLLSRSRFSLISSSTVRILASYGGDISAFVPDFVEEQLRQKFRGVL